MGLLDDAIREHLDLKRRAGADAAEVSKLEHEAFGPVERDEALAAPQDVVPEPFAAPEPEPEPEPEPTSVLAPEPEPVPAAELEGETDRWVAETEVVAEAPAAPTPGAAPEQDATVEFSAVDEPDPQPDPEPGEHDELEETPEFLQEAPEHDRLWFEQKPPRDFDF